MAFLTTLLPSPEEEDPASLSGRLGAVVRALGDLSDLRLELKLAVAPVTEPVERMDAARQAVLSALLALAPNLRALGGVAAQFATMTCLFEAGVEEDHDLQLLGYHFLVQRGEIELEALATQLEPLRLLTSVARPIPEDLLAAIEAAADALEALRGARIACHHGAAVEDDGEGADEGEGADDDEQHAERVGDACDQLKARRREAATALDALGPTLSGAGELTPRVVLGSDVESWAALVRSGLEGTAGLEVWEMALRTGLQEVTVADLRAELRELQS